MLPDSHVLFRAIQHFKFFKPVRAENTHTRDLEFSDWIRANGRPSQSGLVISNVELGSFVAFDLDWLLFDYHRRILRLLEVKTRGASMRFAQKSTFAVLDAICKAGAAAVSVQYVGLSVLRLQNTTPSNSDWLDWDGERISAEECWRRINLLDVIEETTP